MEKEVFEKEFKAIKRKNGKVVIGLKNTDIIYADGYEFTIPNGAMWLSLKGNDVGLTELKHIEDLS